jgi:glucan phosphoethanolaminetransferase (alkaline phosphatase superfamily)
MHKFVWVAVSVLLLFVLLFTFKKLSGIRDWMESGISIAISVACIVAIAIFSANREKKFFNHAGNRDLTIWQRVLRILFEK